MPKDYRTLDEYIEYYRVLRRKEETRQVRNDAYEAVTEILKHNYEHPGNQYEKETLAERYNEYLEASRAHDVVLSEWDALGIVVAVRP